MTDLDEARVRQADEAGVAVEDLEPEDVQEPVPPMQIPLEGFATAISTTPGGDRPQTASLKLRGGALPVSGEFKKGDVVEFYVRARIAEVHFVDTVDKFGEVTGTERRHIAKPVAVQRQAASED